MEFDWYFRLFLAAGLVLCSAFFSGSEIALFSLQKKQLKAIREGSRLIGSSIAYLLEFPRRLLVTILLCNTLVNISATIISVSLALEFAKKNNVSQEIVLGVQIIVLTITILLFGEIVPKVWAAKYSVGFAKVVAIPLYWISILAYPFSKIVTDLIRSFISGIKLDKSITAIHPSEIKDLADLGAEQGSFEHEEHELIRSMAEFGTITAREAMTPRVDIAAVSLDAGFDELVKIINESGYSRLPIYKDSLDGITGIVYAKDILPYLEKPELKQSFNLDKLSRKAMFVPETKLISELLREFQEKKVHLGIVVDEYGGTAGLISFEDILEEVIGEIHDEYDKEENPISSLDENRFLILGKTSVDDVNEAVGSAIPTKESEEFDTIGGFILDHAGMIPSQEYSFIEDNFKYTVKEVIHKRITKVMVEKIIQSNNPG